MQEVQLSQVFFYWVALSMSFTLYNRRDQGLLCSYDLATLWYDVVTLCLWCAYSSSIISFHFFCSYFPFGCSVLSFFITDLELEVLYYLIRYRYFSLIDKHFQHYLLDIRKLLLLFCQVTEVDLFLTNRKWSCVKSKQVHIVTILHKTV